MLVNGFLGELELLILMFGDIFGPVAFATAVRYLQRNVRENAGWYNACSMAQSGCTRTVIAII